MMTFEVEVNVKQLAKLAAKVGGISKRTMGRLQDVVEVDLNLARADMIQTYLSNTETTPTGLARRTGNLVGSWRVAMERPNQGGFSGRLFQDRRYKSAIYGPVHEFGATITAKRVRNLAIPLTEEARAAGTPRKFNDLFVMRTKKGNLILARRFGRQIEPLYKLQPSVRIPPRPFLRPTSEKFFPIILRDMRQALIEGAREAEAGNE